MSLSVGCRGDRHFRSTSDLKGGYQMRFLATCVVLGLAAPLAAISEEFGQIVATYDGEERTWYTIALKRGDEVQASSTYGGSVMDFFNLHLQGHPRPSFTATDVLSVDAMVRGGIDANGGPIDVEIIHLPEGMSGPNWISQDAPTRSTLSIESIDIGEPGDTGLFIGTFSGQVCRRESITSEPDLTNCRMIEGRIDTRLLIE